MLILSGCFSFNVQGEKFSCHVIDVGQGSATLFTYQQKTILIDTGYEHQKFQTYIENFCDANSITCIDYVIITHPDQDHINNTKWLYDNYQINYSYLPCVMADTPLSDKDGFTPIIKKDTKVYKTCIESVVSEPNSTWEYLTDDDINDINGFLIYQSDKFDWLDVNDFSPIIFFIGNKSNIVCISGDATTMKEKWYCANSSKKITVKYYITGHHGSQYSSCDEFVSLLQPQYAIYSSNDSNGLYGHPHINTLTRISKYTRNIYGTEYNGHIELTQMGILGDLINTTTGWTNKNGERITF